MAAPLISALPTAPTRSDPAGFNSTAETFVTALATLRSEINAFGAWLNTNSTIVGGQLDDTVIGGNTPAAGTFTTLVADSYGGDGVQSSLTDTTADRLMKVGAFGIGAGGTSTPEITDFTAAIENGMYRFNASTVTGGPSTLSGECVAIVVKGTNFRTNILAMDGANTTAHLIAFGSRNSNTGAVAWTRLPSEGDTVWFNQLSVGNVTPLDDLHISSAHPGIVLEDTNADTDEKYMRMRLDSGLFRLEGINDAFSSTSNAIVMTRNGRLIDTMGLYTGGSERLTIVSNGDVGIGTSDPARQLHVKTSSDGSARVRLENSEGWADLLADGTRFRLTTNSAGQTTDTNFLDYDGINGRLGINAVPTENLRVHEPSNSACTFRMSNNEGSVEFRVDGGSLLSLRPVSAGANRFDFYEYGRFDILGDASNNNHKLGVFDRNLTLTNNIQRILADRPGGSGFDFLACYSNNATSPDMEFRFRGDGNAFADGSWNGGGADYAEFFEWSDGNPNNENREGLSVVLVGNKIRPALATEVPFGVVSANPSVVGDSDLDHWRGKYLRNDFGAYIKEDYEVVRWFETVVRTETETTQATEPEEVSKEVVEIVDGRYVKHTVKVTIEEPVYDEYPLYNEAGEIIDIYREPVMVEVKRQVEEVIQHSYAYDEVPEGLTIPDDAERVIQQRRKLNPEYDPSRGYTPRAERPEWDTVGLMGKLRVLKGQPVGVSWVKMRDVSTTVEEWLVR